MVKCQKGLTQNNGKCIRKKRDYRQDQKLFDLIPSQRFGLLLIVLSFLVWYMRPLKSCNWWNIFCHLGSFTISPIWIIATGILLIGGIIYLLKLNKIFDFVL